MRNLIRRMIWAALARWSCPQTVGGRPTPHYDNQVGQLGTLPFTRPLVPVRARGRVALWVSEGQLHEVPYVPSQVDALNAAADRIGDSVQRVSQRLEDISWHYGGCPADCEGHRS